MRQTGATFSWWTVGDKRVCPDCEGREGDSHTMAEWRSIYGTPGSALAGTLCGGNCRCSIIPDNLKAKDLRELIEESIDKAVEEALSGIKVDMRTGGKRVMLRDLEQIEGMYTVQYTEIARMELLIHQWKAQYGTLPKEFFELADLDKMIEWLEKNLK